MVRLIGEANETVTILEGGRVRTLIDSGAQISSVTEGWVESNNLEIKEVGSLLDLEGTGGGEVPYLGYVEVNWKVPELEGFERDILLLVIPNSKYGERTPLTIGTLHIDMVLKYMKNNNISGIGKHWGRGGLGAPLSMNQVQKVDEYDLAKVTGKVVASQQLEIAPFETLKVSGISRIKDHRKRIHVMTESQEQGDICAMPSYGKLKPGSSRVPVVLKNLTCRKVVVKKGEPIAHVTAANAVPAMLAPKAEQESLPKLSKNERIKRLFEKLDLSGMKDWGEEDQQKARDLLVEFHDLFALEELEMGRTNLIKHKIRLKDETPFKERYRRIPPQQYDEVRKHLDEMIKVGAIRKSQSPWASAVVLVRKKDGSLRFCIDLRKLNERTIKDAYGLPRIEDSLDVLNGAILFSSVDLKSGYWQVEMDESSIPYTAFTVGPLGFYECTKMPFGLTNAPATFQRLMESCLGDLHLNWCIIYLDDVIIFSRDIQTHLDRLRGVFMKMREAGLKLKPTKCDLFKDRITYLGHVVSKDGIETDQAKIEAICKWPVPETVTEVRSFLGFTNYYRKFIFGYAQLAKPLNLLISGENSSKKRSKVQWTPEAQESFDALKETCSKTPVLAYADYSKEFILQTDASERGLGAVLSQKDGENKERVIAFASRTLKNSEKNYDAHKLEFLALRWSVCDRFYEYLYGSKFKVFTDNNPLTYILTSAKLDAVGQRWVASLAGMDFTIAYKPGKNNKVADALSRIDWERVNESDYTRVEGAVVKAILDKGALGEAPMPPLMGSSEVIVMKSLHLTGMATLTESDWKREQLDDPSIGPIFKIIETGVVPVIINEEARPLWKNKKNLTIKKNVLFRKVSLKGIEGDTYQFVLPQGYRKKALEACHDDMGHLGMDRTLILMQERFFWPGMSQAVRDHIRNCARCLRCKQAPERSPMIPIVCSYPMELIHLDFLSIGQKDKEPVNILVITDHFSRLAYAARTYTQTAQVVARVLDERFFAYYGWPDSIITDQGAAFESKLMREFCEMIGVKKLRTSIYHPEGNGQCERFNQTLIGMIATLRDKKKVNWTSELGSLTFAYNCTTSPVTGHSPFYLMFIRKPRLPVEIALGIPEVEEGLSYAAHVKRMQQQLKSAFQLAQSHIHKKAGKDKHYHDRKVRYNKLAIDDFVMVRIKKFGRDHKIADRWEKNPYQVCADLGNKVYEVKPVDSPGEVRRLHRNMLFPISSIQSSQLLKELIH